MNLSTQFPIDREKAEKGVELPLGDAFFSLTYYESSKAQIYFISQLKKYSLEMGHEEATIKAMRDTLINVVVLGWRNLKEGEGESEVEVVYSKEECSRILEQYVGLDVALMNLSLTVQNYKRELKTEIGGK